MSVRRSLDPTTSKPYNINIYYNINSKNITNNHEVLSHPVTARGLKGSNEEGPNGRKNQVKPKIGTKMRKKKYSVDLGVPTDKRLDKAAKKSNSNSICSGFLSQTNCRRDNDRQEDPKRTTNVATDKNEQKLEHLLQMFSEGKIDKEKLARQIINIFQLPEKCSEEVRERKIERKKKSMSTLMGTATPKNNHHRLQVGSNSNKTVLNIHKARRRQTKSERGSFSNSKKVIFQNQLTQRIIECKNIDSSLFLQAEQEENPVVVDRTTDVQTSYSIVLLNQSLKNERKQFAQQAPSSHETVTEMAIKIQRAWRKHRTNKLIHNIIGARIRFPTGSDSLLEKVQCVSSKNSVEVENFLSQELGRKNVTKQREIARVEQLRDHELNKWNQIMDFVRLSINNRGLPPEECLKQIIQYFEKAKSTIEEELLLENVHARREGELINQMCSRQAISQGSGAHGPIHMAPDDDMEAQHFIQGRDQEQRSLSRQYQQPWVQDKNLPHIAGCFNLQKPRDFSFEVVESTLISHARKLARQHQEKIKSLDARSPNYQTTKRSLQEAFRNGKKQIKRIIANLNKGYAEAKSILAKDDVASKDLDQKNGQTICGHQILQKCKSDNYLLKTAINYKKYIQKKESKWHGELDQVGKVLKKAKYEDNLELKSISSSARSQNSVDRPPKKKFQGGLSSQQNHMMENISSDLDHNELEAGQGYVFNSLSEEQFSRLEEKIFSEEFLQYEQIQKRFDEEEDKQESSLKSQQNSMLMGAEEISLFENTKLNQINKKLKYLTKEDKNDIFEYLFIDLTIQLIVQYDQKSKIYSSIRNYIERKSQFQSIPKGIKTNLQATKDYLNSLLKLVLSEYLEVFVTHLMVPMGPTAKELLKYMRDEFEEEESSQNSSNQLSVALILPVQIFEQLSARIPTQYPRLYDDDAKEMPRVHFLKSLDHFHRKALFDSLNQCLDAQRPFGLLGKPFPWKTSAKNRRNFDWDRSERVEKLQRGVQKVVECCSYMCGILVDKEESVFGNQKVSENYVSQIREDRMSRMLANELTENEEKWAFFDDEETEAQLELASAIELALLKQFTKQLSAL